MVRYIHRNPVGAGNVRDMDQYRWSSHWGYLNKRQRPKWLNTESLLSRFDGLPDYRRYVQSEFEQAIDDFYKGRYQMPILGDKGFVHRVRERLGEKAKVEAAKPESRQVFGLRVEEIVRATAREYGKRVEDLQRRRRGVENQARTMAMYLSWQLGGHKRSEIGKALGLDNQSSVSSACLRMKLRVVQDRKIDRRARRITGALTKS